LEVDVLEFRLVYKGPLPSDTGDGNKAKYKHLIRKHFHQQLRQLWKVHPSLRAQLEGLWIKVSQNDNGTWNVIPVTVFSGNPISHSDQPVKTWVEHVADDHQCAGARWVPLVSKLSGLACSVDILFLRRDGPGDIVWHGDIDNRIKTLFDGLRKPEKVSDLGGYSIDPDEEPFYCLLEDDRLISGFTVTTDRLLLPLAGEEKDHMVELVVNVKVTNPNALFENKRLV